MCTDHRRARRRIAALAFAAALLPGVAPAEGQLEINEACVATGCFEGDTAGYPVSATSAGSYVLTSNLVVPSANTTAISLGAGASLDLGGFSITGPTSCTGIPAVCTGAGTGSGISAGARSAVRNGRVAGMGNSGVSASEGVRLSDLTIHGNGGNGILGSGGTLVERCVIESNGLDGISIEAGQVAATVIQGNSVRRNGENGIDVTAAIVKDNGVTQNGGFGFEGTASALSGNNFYNNNSFGDQISGGVEIGENLCDGSTTCP